MDKKTLQNLYQGKHKQSQLRVKLKGYSDPFDIDLGRYTPDCNINHFGYNFYFRTKAGLRGLKYTSFGKLKNAVTKRAEQLGLTIESFLIQIKNRAIKL